MRFLLDLLLPRACAGCGRELPGAALCPACVPTDLPVAAAGGAYAAGTYDGALRAAVLSYKERGRRDLADDLGRLLARAVAASLARDPPGLAGAAVPVLVPVPSSRAAAAARGGDHVLRLARRAGRRLGLPVVTALQLVRPGRDSAGLTAVERAHERHGSMRARRPGTVVGGRPVVVIDDVITTGATLREAQRALHAAGWTVLGSAVVAATPRIGPKRAVTIGRSQESGLACGRPRPDR